jgi:cytochrome c oxidase subunit 2
MTVNVMGLQYAWLFTYPDTGITTGELHIPVGQEVQLNISAQDVLHAFWLPEFPPQARCDPQDGTLNYASRPIKWVSTPSSVPNSAVLITAQWELSFSSKPQKNSQGWLQEQQAVASNGNVR